MGLGLIGLGIVGQNSSVNNGPVATGSLPAANAPGITPLSNRGGLGGLAGGIGTIAPNSGLNPFLTGSGGGAGNGATTTFGNTPNGDFTSPGSGSPIGGGGGNATTPPGGTTTNPPPQQVNSTSTVLNSPVASVTQNGGTTSLNINSGPTNYVGSVTTCSSQGVGLTVGSTTVGCQPAGPAPAPSPGVATGGTPTTPVGGGPTGQNSTTKPPSSVTKTITNTVTSVSGL